MCFEHLIYMKLVKGNRLSNQLFVENIQGHTSTRVKIEIC